MANDHIQALFEGQELSEDFKEKTQSIIESMVEEKVEEVKSNLKEDHEKRVNEKLEELENLSESYIEEEVLPMINRYLTAAVNEWLEDNETNLVSEAKVNLADSFMKGLVGLTEQHNLSVPEGSDSVVSQLETQVSELQEKLDKETEKRVSISEENETLKRERIESKVVSDHDLAESQVEKIKPVIEKLNFRDDEQYESAVNGIVESYFPKKEEGEENHDVSGSNEPENVNENHNNGGGNNYYSSLISQL